MHHEHGRPASDELAEFEPEAWDERYSGAAPVWSGSPNAVLVDVASDLPPGTALDLGCGEGGDVLWLAANGWRVTGADFSARGLARAASHAAAADVADRVEWWQTDARTFSAEGRAFDFVTTHFLHPPDGGMVDVLPRLAVAVAPGRHLLVVGHAPSGVFAHVNPARRRAMWRAEDLVLALPDGFTVLAAEELPRTAVRDGVEVDVEDAVLLACRASD